MVFLLYLTMNAQSANAVFGTAMPPGPHGYDQKLDPITEPSAHVTARNE